MMTLLPDFASDLTRAIVSSSTSPLLPLAGDLTVLTVSKSFCAAFDIQQPDTGEMTIFSLGDGEWDTPQLRSLLEGVASGMASVASYEMDLKRAGHGTRCLLLYPQKLEYGDIENARILLAVSDVTDARLNDKLKAALIAEKAVLLQEIQHRVANSLQIIASILMQSARRVQSDETRGHLQDAHSRVMSLAAVQQQLSISQETAVEMRSYLTQLCKSLAASMIRDPENLSIVVHCENVSLPSDKATSLGLIITELVINSLKHAFPGNAGKIIVRFEVAKEDWVLRVQDDGVGMVRGAATSKPGLGTSLIEALAQKLDAQIVVTDANPGTEVSLFHSSVKRTEAGLSASNV